MNKKISVSCLSENFVGNIFFPITYYLASYVEIPYACKSLRKAVVIVARYKGKEKWLNNRS
jgi:hypothetical protein